MLYTNGGVLLETSGGLLADDENCCCEPVVCDCPTLGQWSMEIEDIDNAWGGNVDLGPHTLSWISPVWHGTMPEATIFPDRPVSLDLECLEDIDGHASGDWSFCTVAPDGGGQPWGNDGFLPKCETVTGIGCDPTEIVFDFFRDINAYGALWGDTMGAHFRVTFTRV